MAGVTASVQIVRVECYLPVPLIEMLDRESFRRGTFNRSEVIRTRLRRSYEMEEG